MVDEVTAISKDFIRIRNTGGSFDAQLEEIGSDLKALQKEAEESTLDDDEREARVLFLKQANKMFKRIDDGTIFPPQALDPVETSVRLFEAEASEQQGSLRLIDALAMPAGTIAAGNTSCSEQGSGRWLPKPSDTLGTLVKISNRDIGYKGIPMLWYEQKPLAEMLGFFIPDWVADLVPGEYPRHKPDGTIEENLKTKVLNVACLLYTSPSPRDS